MNRKTNLIFGSSLKTLLLFVFVASGCTQMKSLTASQSAQGGFVGCITGMGLTNTSIEVTFDFPSGADKVVVYRDGIEVGLSNIPSVTSIVDTNLTEGVTYQYSCNAFIGARKLSGSNFVQAAPVNTNAPLFGGITGAVLGSSSLLTKVTWNPESSAGAKASYYNLYYNTGTTVNWNLAPKNKLQGKGVFSFEVSGLGDEINYSFGIRACTKTDVCDNNTIIKTFALPDRGAPQTLGAVSATAGNFTAYVTAPWSDNLGAVAQRKIFYCVGTSCTFNTNPQKTVPVPDLTAAPTLLTIEGISENTTYKIKVVDVDPTGNSNNSAAVVTLVTGDLTAPTFLGISNISRGVPADSTIGISFTAVAREGTADSGATYGTTDYLVYLNSAVYPALASNSCLNPTPYQVISASAYPPGASAINLTNLNPRTNYNVCLLARDAAGNISNLGGAYNITTADVTAPDFDGVQSFTFNSNTKKLEILWNSSNASDINKYVVKLWKNQPNPTTPSAVLVTSLEFPSGSYPNGVTLTSANYAYSDFDMIYAMVNACDNASAVPASSDNCTNFAYDSAAPYNDENVRFVQVPDVLPPQGFAGIKTEAFQSSTTQGYATVAWLTPTWTSDYYGFNIYNVNTETDNSLTFVAQCPCATPGSCNASDSQCTFGNGNLNPSRTYHFHVRAYDAVGNETSYSPMNNPSSNYANLKIKDSTPPIFNSGLNIAGFALSWVAATDNQYNGQGNNITYRVYRKFNTTFADPLQPEADASSILPSPTTGFTAPNYYENSLSSGGTYYYTVCALDSALNRTCDGNVKSLVANDVTAPFLSNFYLSSINSWSKPDLLKSWRLTWTMNDAGSPSNLRVKIFRKTSESDPAILATTADEIVYDSVDSNGTLTTPTMQGPIDQNAYINYFLWVQDQAGNISTLQSNTFRSNNRISIDAIKSNQGTYLGGLTIVIQGTGFSQEVTPNGFGDGAGTDQDTKVKIGSQDCLNTQVISSEFILCTTPAQAIGTYNVTVTNPDGSSVVLSSAYAYIDGATSSNICDRNPATWDTTGMATGDGSVANPYIICTASHLSNLNNSSPINYISGGFNFKLGNNIDLASFSNGLSINAGAGFKGTIDGNGYSILNNNISLNTGSLITFLTVGSPASDVTFKNTNLINFSVNALSGMSTGSLVSLFHATTTGTTGSLFVLDSVQIYVTYNVDPTVISPMIGLVTSGSTGFPTIKASIKLNSNSYIAQGLNRRSKITSVCNAIVTAAGSISRFGAFSPIMSNNAAVSPTQKVELRDTQFMTKLVGVSGTQTVNIGGIFGSVSINSANPFDFTMNNVDSKLIIDSITSTAGQRVGGIGGDFDIYNSTITNSKIALEVNATTFPASGRAYGGLFGYVSKAKNLIVQDVSIEGNINGSANRSPIAPFMAGSAMTTKDPNFASTISFQRVLSNMYFPSGSGNIYQSMTTDGTFAGLTGVGNFVNTDLTGSGFASVTLANTVSSTTHITTALQNQNPGNVLELAGYDFLSGSKAWKWCSTNNYPRLIWETCP